MTDNITIPHSVYEQVLEALNNITDYEGLSKARHAMRAALEQPQQDPRACGGRNCGSTDPRYHSRECLADQQQTDLYDAFVYGLHKGKEYDQTALELCNECGWKTLIPGDCCLNCARDKGSYKVTHNGNCVDETYTWRPIDDETPMGVKVQVLTVGGIATHVRLTLNTKGHYTHWTPLPRKP